MDHDEQKAGKTALNAANGIVDGGKTDGAPTIDLDQFEELAQALREADEAHADAWADSMRARKIMENAASAQTAARTALRAYVEQCAGARINSI